MRFCIYIRPCRIYYLFLLLPLLVVGSFDRALSDNLGSVKLLKLEPYDKTQPHPLAWLSQFYMEGSPNCSEDAVFLIQKSKHHSYNPSLLGIAYIQRSCWELAEQAFLDALVLDPKNLITRYWLGLAQYVQGDYIEATNNWAQANAGQIFVGAGRYLWQSGHSAEGLKWYELAVIVGQHSEESPARTQTLGLAFWDMAEMVQQEGDPTQDVAAYFEQAVEYLPNDARLRHSLANYYVSQGNLEKALFHMREAALNIQTDSPILLCALGEIYLQSGSEEEAKQFFTASLQAVGPYPELDRYWHIRAWYGLSEVYYQRQESENSVLAAFKAIELEGEIVPWRKEQLSRIFQSALVAHPDRLDLYLRIGQLYEDIDEQATALSFYTQALQRWPNDPLIHQALQRLNYITRP